MKENDELSVRYNMAQQVIGDLSIDRQALIQTCTSQQARIVELVSKVSELEQFIAALQAPLEISGSTNGRPTKTPKEAK